MFRHSLKSQYIFPRQNHIYNNQHLFLTVLNKGKPLPLPHPRYDFEKLTWEEEGIQVWRSWLRDWAMWRSSSPQPTERRSDKELRGRSWCPIKRTISLQKSQGTTHNPNKVAVHSRTGACFRACYPWEMAEVQVGGWVRRRLSEDGWVIPGVGVVRKAAARAWGEWAGSHSADAWSRWAVADAVSCSRGFFIMKRIKKKSMGLWDIFSLSRASAFCSFSPSFFFFSFF